MTSREAQSPPKLFNMDAVEADTYTHIHNSTCAHTQTCGHKCTPAHSHTHIFYFIYFFAPKTMHGWCFAPADDEEW